MTSRALTRVAAARSRARRPAEVRAMLARFEKATRPALARLVASHPYFEDLMWSFPGVLTVLAHTGNAHVRAETEAMITAGAPLGAIARRLDVPAWLRRLPPEAYRGPLPKLPRDAGFALQISNHLPQDASTAQAWLATLAAAYAACDSAFAIWAAREFAKLNPLTAEQGASVIGVFAWMSARPALAGSAPRKLWQRDLGAIEARDAARAWLIDLEMQLYASVREARFRAAPRNCDVRGITFQRLTTPDDLTIEGNAMHHCLGSYGSHLARGCSAFWNLSEDGEDAGSLQVRIHPHWLGRPVIGELKAAFNDEVQHRVWAAVQAWLADWGHAGAEPSPCGCFTAPDVRTWQEMWKPYWKAKGTSELLPLRPQCNGLSPAHAILASWLR